MKLIKEKDPDSCIAEHSLRKWIADKKVKTIQSGTRAMVNIKSLEKFLADGDD